MKWIEMTDDERAEREINLILWQLEMIDAGLAVRAHGLIYFLPLCHDAYGEGNA